MSQSSLASESPSKFNIVLISSDYWVSYLNAAYPRGALIGAA